MRLLMAQVSHQGLGLVVGSKASVPFIAALPEMTMSMLI
jgi:hypothetical protein